MRYRVDIYQQEKLLFSVNIEHIDKNKRERHLELLIVKFPSEEGYQLKAFYSDHEIRYLKSTGDSVELLAALPVYQLVPHS
ncbi:hypothetical protein [Vibrio pectenicida]|uniref:Uncharacterized protein n=1 Tax=Vibrio pectenicida TaxID=62763 RepID=A0A3R9FPU0_9VIBR|nr:hypothetical protein [Vibrio pectenicida]RSD31462.1 hypothetical protein EJA03_08555 [Vibrio pectenicida]